MEARQQLREWREREGLKQTEAAALLGVTRNFIGFLEQGGQKPGLSMANTLKRLAGIPTEAWDKPPEPDPSPIDVRPSTLAGRCSSELDRGWVAHAVPVDGNKALCGVKPGRLSAGWAVVDGPVNCARCKRRSDMPMFNELSGPWDEPAPL